MSPQTPRPTTPERPRIEPLNAESARVEPADAERAEVAAADARRARVEPADAERAEFDAADAGGTRVESADAERTDVDAVDAGRARVESVDAERAEVGAVDAGRARVESVDAERAEVGAADAGRARVESVDAGRARVESVDAERAEVGVADAGDIRVESVDAGWAQPGAVDAWRARVESADWASVAAELDEYGGALLPQLLTSEEAVELRDLYERDEMFRSTIDMGRHRFGEGQYRYLRAPYPEPVERLKQALYPRLLPIARDWWTKLGRAAPWPDTLEEWLRMCHDAGQTKSTAILLKYGEKDWNALHRDLYGDLVFPLQVVINLNEPGVDHTGGEFLLLEQRPRAQSRGTATLLPHGHGYVFTTRDRPVRSARGWSAAPVRHGVSAIRSGERYTLALVFHDAA